MTKTLHLVLLWISLFSFPPISQAFASESSDNHSNLIPLSEIYIRDPCILADKKTNTYYLYRSASAKSSEGTEIGGVEVFKSKDLKNWEGPMRVFTVPEANWINGNVWAPEVHEYNGKYYLFATLNSKIIWKKKQEGWADYLFRGTQIFHADSPEGPFLPFGLTPHTPMDRMALDGTLWVEDGTPYMIYCHEWVQIADGTMELVELAKDLSAPVGNSMTLFCASAADWSTGSKHEAPLPTSYVTDGCFLYRSKTNKLLMIWSSFMNGEYAIGIAESATGKVAGPWKQQATPLFHKNGGHGMIFKSFDGKLYITFHGPNSPAGAERAHIYELEDIGDTLILKKEIRE
ncbi:glycoside hydrolase family 43 protein [Massilibacteroides sp.]|uniref:glycoside hydrolase family 43 protein n=1 Tax=Massilibacteroides sp. TaxID=2034766 RepID=UPI002637655C|nr:glycoside hydrolase family 43 protein [Massilibacteroides sp.]MDD4514066.1 glycoside hydrolase family 43 protein [Massilibacteroides sp.]